jgi:hypothetical protein
MLISYLTSIQTVLPFQNLKQLIEVTQNNIVLAPGTSSADEFRYSGDPLWKRAWTERIEPSISSYPSFMSEQMKYIIENPGNAIYGTYIGGKYTEEYRDCKVIDIPADYNYKSIGFAFPHNSPFLGPFNHVLKRMIEGGTVDKIKIKYATQPQVCPDTSGQALGFESCCSAFLIFLTGLTMSSIFLCMETLGGLSKNIKRSTGIGTDITNFFTYEIYDKPSEEYLQARVQELEEQLILSYKTKNCYTCSHNNSVIINTEAAAGTVHYYTE